MAADDPSRQRSRDQSDQDEPPSVLTFLNSYPSLRYPKIASTTTTTPMM